MIPGDLRYTDAHEWVRDLGDGVVRVGITDHAQEQLGDVVFVQLPDVGRQFDAGAALGEVESTKSVSDIYAPLAGTVVAVNESLADHPELINSGPFEEGWMVDLRLADGAGDTAEQLGALLDADSYGALTAQA